MKLHRKDDPNMKYFRLKNMNDLNHNCKVGLRYISGSCAFENFKMEPLDKNRK